MFTGIVTAVGTIASVRRPGEGAGTGDGGRVLRIRAPYRGLKRGESVAVSGACLTVTRVLRGGFEVEAVGTTLGRTLFGEYARGRRVNLERAVRAADRLGGHLVQGHVDGVGTVERVERRGDAWLYDLRVPPEVAEVTILHGSVAVDGVSLTVNALPAPGVVQISLIPHTVAVTTLGALAPGDRVHVEADVVGKYVRQLCSRER
ncbi:MAG TPA: riboflavin synthase [Gemmatimonadales bacterium]|nr:riboflavin synthase [Gemmatimonadales bacterium]